MSHAKHLSIRRWRYIPADCGRRAPCQRRPYCLAPAVNAAKHSPSAAEDAAPVVVVALGGNALLRRGEEPRGDVQQRHAAEAAQAVKQLIDAGYAVTLTHGNGPQVGLLALQDPDARLEVLDAESEGQLGFLLELALQNALPGSEVVALLTQVVVDPGDEAFQHPRKHIGKHYSKEEAERLARDKGWSVAPDGDSYRRVVPSPLPHDIVEARAIQTLIQAGFIVVCCGGGGIPVAVDKDTGRRRGVEAVVDKDEASALLAIKLNAKYLLMLTDEAAIYDPTAYPKEKRAVPSPTSCNQLRGMPFESGSMAPKVSAACRYLEATGGRVAVGAISEALNMLEGGAGTQIEAD